MKRKALISTFSIIGLLCLLFILSPKYLQNSLIYLFPGINDYKIFENREVKTKVPQKWPLATNYMSAQLTKTERDTLEKYKSVAYLIIKNDSIVYEEYWDDYNQNSISNSFSVSKSIISLLIGAAIQDGYIKDVNQAVGDFIPEFNNAQGKELRIKHLLTMSSGSNWNESYSNPFSITTQAYYGENINSLVKGLKIVETPGKEFSYKSGDTQLLSIVLKNATKKTISQYASEKLWIPLGAVNDALWSLDKLNGDEKAYCCFNSNARDFARIGKVIINRGNINGKQVIPEQYIINSTEPASELVHHKSKKTVDFYGYQWWIVHLNNESIPYARGIYGQYIFVLQKENAIVVRLGHKRSYQKINHHPSDIFSYLSTAQRIISQR